MTASTVQQNSVSIGLPQSGVVAGCRLNYWVAPGNCALRKAHRIARPGCGFRSRVVCTQDLSAAGQRGVALGSLVGACLQGLLVGPGADQIPFLNQGGDDFGCSVVLLNESAIGLAGLRVGKDDSSAQRRVPFQIHGTNRALIHEKDDFAPRLGKSRPAVVHDRFFQRCVLAAHIVGSNHFLGLEDRANLSIQRIEGSRGEFFRRDRVVLRRQVRLLGLDQNIDREMPGGARDQWRTI